jgi:CBS domain-containing protein
MAQNPVVVKQDTEIDEMIDIILQKAIILIPIVDDEYRLIGFVSRFDKT